MRFVLPMRLKLCLIFGVALAGAAGCAHRPPPVQPWQREHLSKRAMQFDEGSDLGFGQPGGGCGCN